MFNESRKQQAAKENVNFGGLYHDESSRRKKILSEI
jgi:hypothetical protein